MRKYRGRKNYEETLVYTAAGFAALSCRAVNGQVSDGWLSTFKMVFTHCHFISDFLGLGGLSVCQVKDEENLQFPFGQFVEHHSLYPVCLVLSLA